MSQYRPRERAGHRRGTDHRSRVDKHKAAEVAGEELSSYRALSYDELVSKIGYAESFERISETGEPYQIEVDFHFDDSKEQKSGLSRWFPTVGGPISPRYPVILLWLRMVVSSVNNTV